MVNGGTRDRDRESFEQCWDKADEVSRCRTSDAMLILQPWVIFLQGLFHHNAPVHCEDNPYRTTVEEIWPFSFSHGDEVGERKRKEKKEKKEQPTKQSLRRL